MEWVENFSNQLWKGFTSHFNCKQSAQLELSRYAILDPITDNTDTINNGGVWNNATEFGRSFKNK